MVDLPLHPVSQIQPLSEAVALPSKSVYFDKAYDAQLITGSTTNDVRNLEIYLNGYPLSHHFYTQSGNFQFSDQKREDKLFLDCFGLSQFKLIFTNKEGRQVLVSDRFQVKVMDGEENENVMRMGRYVANCGSRLLYGTKTDYARHKSGLDHGINSLEDKIRLLKHMAVLLENNWRTISLHPRTRAVEKEKELLSSSAKLVRYLSRNPEAMHPVAGNAGIQIGSSFYVPQLPKFTGQKEDTDVYENQCILSFLKMVYADISSMILQLQEITQEKREKRKQGEYVNSSYFLVTSSMKVISDTIADLTKLKSEYSRLNQAYESIIPATRITLTSPPKPTPAFLSLPGYRKIYEDMQEWFALRNVTVRDLKFMTAFLQVTQLYEVYVLTKLQAFLESAGYSLASSRRMTYEMDPDSLFVNASLNNVFVYENESGSEKVTLYYQPVIYDYKRAAGGQIPLFRNTSQAYFTGRTDSFGRPEVLRGSYYTPDFVLKIESDQFVGSRYILGDAKYTSRANAINTKAQPLIYKYLFSLSCLHPQDQITGLWILHGKVTGQKGSGKGQKKDLTQSFYDRVPSPHSILPQVEIISVAETDEDVHSHQMKTFKYLLDTQLSSNKMLYQAHVPVKELEETPQDTENPDQEEEQNTEKTAG
jgi:hypothetical protein